LDSEQPLNLRCLALTGTFETGCLPPACFGALAGDFDGQGLSYSALQWNLGQGTLQPLLLEMNEKHRDLMTTIFGTSHGPLSTMLELARPAQLAWARSLQQSPGHKVAGAWTTAFRTLGATLEFQNIATHHAAAYYGGALDLCRKLGLRSQRAAALLFDISVQNGGIPMWVMATLQRDFSAMPHGDVDVVEVARMHCVADRIADSAAPRWREDVRTRKMAIAGGIGIVHGLHYDLEAQFGITLAPWQAA